MASGNSWRKNWCFRASLASLSWLAFSLQIQAQVADPTQHNLNSSSPKQSQAPAKSTPDPTAGPDNKSSQASSEYSVLQVFIPPVLEKGKPVWGSIYDSDGSILSEQKILINNVSYQSNEFGSFNFSVPSTDTLSVAVLDEQNNKIWEAKYISSAHGLLVSDKSAAEIVDSLDELASHLGNEPIISHAPSMVEAQQTFVVLGKNFSGKQGDNDVDIDGGGSDVLAASPRCLVVVSPKNLKLGAIKELKVASHNLSSLPAELDIIRVDLRIEPASSGGKNKVRVNLIGSTLPAAVSVSNPTLKANLRFGGWRLGKQNIFLSPGGQANRFEIDADPSMSLDSLSAHIVSNGIFDPYSLKTTRNLISKAVADLSERSEAVRLKTREIAIEAQQVKLNQERQSLSKSGKLTLDDESRIDNNEKANAARLYRVDKMLQSRRAVIESDGSADFTKLVDGAANNNLGSLDNLVAGKDLGLTEARLLKVSGRRSEEQANGGSLVYMPQYKSPSAAFLDRYRKKYGRRGMVPPPPDTLTLLPPPAPYRPGPDDLMPFVTEYPAQKLKASGAKAGVSSKTNAGAKKGKATDSTIKHKNKHLSKARSTHVSKLPERPRITGES